MVLKNVSFKGGYCHIPLAILAIRSAGHAFISFSPIERHSYLGLKAFTGRIQRNGVTHLLPIAMRTDKGILKAKELQDRLRENKVIIPTIDVV